ncbi:MAG: hypothetical protein IPN29_11825 [Saprospiraceae bacterium]|nr:hypothetical protein [Saprospiraceae bacterium]
MEITIQQYLQYKLHKDRIVALPELGSLRLVRFPSTFSSDRTTLFPPYYKLEFDGSGTISAESHDSNMLLKLTELSKVILNSILSSGKATLGQIGYFEQQAGTVFFHANPEFESSFTAGLEPIHEISEISRVFFKPDESPSDILEVKKKASWLYRWLPLMVVIVLGFLLLLWPAAQKPQTSKVLQPPKKDEVIVDSVEPIETAVSDTAVTIAEEIPVGPNVTMPCVIITGSFKKAKYVLLMTERLQKLGYDVYTEETDSTTRVGLKYDCGSMDPDSLLSLIRTKVEKKSWILK